MSVKAHCPTCAKVVAVAGPTSPIAGRLLRHRSAKPDVGMCPAGGSHRARQRDLAHPCKRCRELPTVDLVLSEQAHAQIAADGVELRPPTPRPLKARGYCASHLREVQRAERERAAERRREQVYGVDALAFAELVDAQGGGCACGQRHERSRRRLAVDHDHEREAQCVAAGRHEAGRACARCVRGALGQQCNELLAERWHFTPEQLRNLADYIERPTAQRLGWWDVTPGVDPHSTPG